ncbi:hypothetical protein OPIT5_12175 [Opitutaceae bacterium TAV5]|nr:hypothetical protein OPIT5_12175 [Opitutaceae bacterium TAV5]
MVVFMMAFRFRIAGLTWQVFWRDCRLRKQTRPEFSAYHPTGSGGMCNYQDQI